MNGLTGQESLSVCLTATEEDNGKLDVMSVVMAITMEGKDQKISGIVILAFCAHNWMIVYCNVYWFVRENTLFNINRC